MQPEPESHKLHQRVQYLPSVKFILSIDIHSFHPSLSFIKLQYRRRALPYRCLIKLPIPKMGLVPWKLNKTSSQIVLCRRVSLRKSSLEVFRQTVNEHFNKCTDLFFRNLKDGIDTLKHSLQNNLEGLGKSDVRQFVCKKKNISPSERRSSSFLCSRAIIIYRTNTMATWAVRAS